VLTLAFGASIVLLPIGGSPWIMANLDMVPMDRLMRMRRQARRFGSSIDCGQISPQTEGN
jgi:hypothetical protein